MENEHIEERIDRYILGQMSDEEKAIFEKEIEKDERIKERLHLQQAIPAAIQKAHLKHLFEMADEQIESENTDLVDNYILGRLSKEQCEDFEKKLNEDVCLKETYERQKKVVSSVQKAHLRETFEKCEKEIVDNGIVFPGDEEIGKVIPMPTTNTVTAANKPSLRIIITYAVAACLALMLLVCPKVFYSSSMRDYSGTIQIDNTTIRGVSEIAQIADLINDGDCDEASLLLNRLEKNEPETYKQFRIDMDWYKCVIHMKKGQVIRAWRGLKKISKSDSPYKKKAQDALDEIFK